MSYFGLDKIRYIFTIIKENGGLWKTCYKMHRMDTIKIGTLMGTDKYGNKYFENKKNFYGRNRWVEYAPYYGLQYDASQVPAEWYGWLHYKTDYLPSKDPGRPKYKWMLDHSENMTSTSEQYVPYSTTLPKIKPWIPNKK